MKHTRVPRTVCRDNWWLAMKALSIPSLRILWSRTRNQIKSRIENRKKTNGPNRSKRLKNRKIYIPCATLDYYLGWLMWCKVCISNEPSYKKNGASKFNLPYGISDQTGLRYANFVPTLISPTWYGLLYFVMFLQQRTKDTRTNNPIDQGVDKYSPWRCLLLLTMLLLW